MWWVKRSRVNQQRSVLSFHDQENLHFSRSVNDLVFSSVDDFVLRKVTGLCC